MVPDGWKNTHLIELIEGQIKNGYSPNATDHITGYWVLGLGALGEDGFNDEAIKPVEPTEKVLGNLLACNDFLVSRSNTPDKVGRAVRYKGELSNCSFPDLMMRFRIDPKKADLDYVEQKIRSSSIRNYYKSRAAGSSSTMVKITKSVVEKTPIQLPPLSEQKKIAKILSAWDRAIEVTEKLISSSQLQKKSLMQQLLTGKMRNTGFSSEWGSVKVKSIFKSRVEKADNNDYTIFSVTKGGIVDQARYFNKKVASEDTSGYRVIRNGNYVMSGLNFWMGSIDVYMGNEIGIVSPAYKVFKINDQFDVIFIKQLVRSEVFRKVLEGSSIQGASVVRRNFSKSIFENWSLTLPCIDEQKKIAAVLFSADKEVDILQQKVEFLKQEKKALMQQLLTGKHRVKVDDKDFQEVEV